jgi:hypothetical protein
MPPVRRCPKYIRQARQAHPVYTVPSSMVITLVRAALVLLCQQRLGAQEIVWSGDFEVD